MRRGSTLFALTEMNCSLLLFLVLTNVISFLNRYCCNHVIGLVKLVPHARMC